MGLKSNFSAFLRRYYTPETVPLSEYAYRSVAVDVSLYMHKYKHGYGTQWLNAFVRLIQSLRRNNIHCVFIFDGPSPPEKRREQDKRRAQREVAAASLDALAGYIEEHATTGRISDAARELHAASLTKARGAAAASGASGAPCRRFLCDPSASGDTAYRASDDLVLRWLAQEVDRKTRAVDTVQPGDYARARDLFGIMNVPYYEAPSEAEKMCAKLCMDGRVQAVLTEDTDIVAYAAPVSLAKIDLVRDTCRRTVYGDVLAALGMDARAFLDLCIMCGTDYNPNLPRIGAVKAYRLLSAHGSVEAIADRAAPPVDVSPLNIHRVRHLFTVFDTQRYPAHIPYCVYPDMVALEMFARKHRLNVDVGTLQRDVRPGRTVVFVQGDARADA